jgi:hypothetical protein
MTTRRAVLVVFGGLALTGGLFVRHRFGDDLED